MVNNQKRRDKGGCYSSVMPLLPPKNSLIYVQFLGSTTATLRKAFALNMLRTGVDLSPEKHISTMDDEIYFFCQGDVQDLLVVGEEIVTTPASLNAGMHRKIETKMAI